MDSGVLQGETGAEEGSFEEEQDQILDALVILVLLGALPQVVHDGMVGVDLQMLLGGHVT
jgi:hypothetical protein